jgi:hypothetical protein
MPLSCSRSNAGFTCRLQLADSSVLHKALVGRFLTVAVVFVCLLGGLAPRQLHAQNVTLVPYIVTVAGTGTAGCTGDGGPATSAELNLPGALLDRAGYLYTSGGSCNNLRVVNTLMTPITVAGVTIPPGYIASVAGTGAPGYTGDGGPAIQATLNSDRGVVRDSTGNLYIVDSGNNVIRKIDTNGIITTFAGNGAVCTNSASTTSPCGDGGAATSAQFNQPLGITIDSAGNLYIGDELDYRVRKILTDGTITTVAGNGTQGYTGDGGQATSAQIGVVGGVEVDGTGNLYLPDFSNNVIRKVDTTGTITTLLGTGTAGYTPDGSSVGTMTPVNNPHSIVHDGAGNFYFADAGNNIVRKVDTNGIIATVAGNYALGAGYNGDGGPAVGAQLNFPVTVSLDSGGNIYIGDFSNNRVREVVTGPVPFFNIPVGTQNYSQLVRLSFNTTMTLSNVQVTLSDYSPTLLGSCDPSVSAPTVCEWAVYFTPSKPGPRWGSFVVTDSHGNKYSFGLEGTGVGSALAFTPGIISTVAGNGTVCSDSTTPCGDGGAATSANLNNPTGVTIDSAGNLYIADNGNNRIRVVNAQTAPITVAGVTIGPGNIGTVAGDGTRGFSAGTGQATTAELYYPAGVALDGAGNLYIADNDNALVRKVDVNGIITTFAGAGAGIGGGCATATDSFGDGCPAIDAHIGGVAGVAVDTASDVYIADWGDGLVRKVDSNGIITSIAGNGNLGFNGESGPATSVELQEPSGMALDSAGNLYIADTFNHRVRKLANGVISTVAGSGSVGVGGGGYSGDGGPATQAQLNMPYGLAVDSAGNLYIADAGNYVIRKMDSNGIITTVAGAGPYAVACPFGTYLLGDGCPATSAFIGFPEGVSVGGGGNLYVADGEDNRIRKVNVSTGILAFGSETIGQMSSAQNIAVSDIGNASLNFSLITYGDEPFEGTNVANGCVTGTPVGIGQTCELATVFVPTIAGNLLGGITFSDDAFNSPQFVNLTGTGLKATPTVVVTPNPATITFGAASMITVTVIGTAGIPQPTGTVTVSDGLSGSTDYCTVTLSSGSGGCTLTPTAAGTLTVTAAYNGDSNYTTSGAATPLTVTPAVVYFTLTVGSAGTGSGTVTDNLGQINCTDTAGSLSGTCSASYLSGASVTLTATPTAPSTFGGWGGGCASSGTSTTCTLTVNAAESVSADFVPPPAAVNLPAFTPGTNVSQMATFCPNNSNPCTDSNGHALTLSIPLVNSSFSLTVTATEYPADPPQGSAPGDGLCPQGGNGQSSDLDCRFVSYFNYGTDSSNNTIVPLCFPYANGNCVHYQVYETGMPPGTEPDPSLYSGGVFWKIGFNNSSFVPTSYWAGSTPRLLDDPDENEVPGLPYGTVCSTAMYVNGQPTVPPIYCQYDRDITTFYNASGGLDSTIGGKTKQPNDVIVAFLPTTAGNPSNGSQQPPSQSAPSMTGACVNGCTISGSNIVFTAGAGGTFAVAAQGYPVPTLTESGTLPNGLTFNPANGLISGTPADGTVGNYPIVLTATNVKGAATLNYTLTVATAPLIITASSSTTTYGGTVPTITASYSGFVNGDTASNLTTQPTCTTTATSRSPAGTYPSVCSGAVDPNYMITYVGGAVMVNPAPLTITASGGTMTYGGTVPVITPSFVGFVNGDTASNLTTQPTCTTTATSKSPAGTYPSSCSGAVDPNYMISYANGTVSVSALEIWPTTVNFGTVYFELVAGQFVTLTNTGTTPIMISSVKVTAPGNALGDYGEITLCPPVITVLPATLGAGQSCSIGVGIWATAKIFSPTASTATLSITDSAAGSPHAVALTTQVINPQATLSAYSLTFPSQKVGTTSAAKSVTLTNTGNTPLNLGTLSVSGNFALASGTACSNGGSLAAGANCVINVAFTPTAKGTRSGSVKITDNALISPQIIWLTGTGN